MTNYAHRHSTLYSKRGTQPAVEKFSGGITRARAHLRHEMSLLIRAGFQITQDRDDRAIMRLGTEQVDLYIEADPPRPRAAGGGRLPIVEDEETVRATITLPASLLARLQQLGDGNASLGVRRLLEQE